MARTAQPFYSPQKDAWYVRHDGRRLSLSVTGANAKAAALRAWGRLLAHGRPEPMAKPEAPTVSDIIHAFLADADSRVQPITLRFYNRFLLPFAERFGHTRADRLTTAQAEAWSRKPTWSASTRHDALGTLATAFRWATERARLLTANPLRGLRLPPKASAGTSAVVTADAFTSALAHITDADFRAYLRFLWLTGCRPGEAASLTFADVTGDCATLRHHKTAHRGHSRTIYLSAIARNIIAQQKRRHGSGLVYRNRFGVAFDRMDVVKRLWRLKRKTGIAITAYGFRHAYATRALSAGVPDAHVAALLGHSGTAMLHRHYSHLTARADVLRQAAAMVR